MTFMIGDLYHDLHHDLCAMTSISVWPSLSCRQKVFGESTDTHLQELPLISSDSMQSVHVPAN